MVPLASTGPSFQHSGESPFYDAKAVQVQLGWNGSSGFCPITASPAFVRVGQCGARSRRRSEARVIRGGGCGIDTNRQTLLLELDRRGAMEALSQTDT
jgi:hypothetical protein